MKPAYYYNNLVRLYNRSGRKLSSLITAGRNFRKQNILKRRMVRWFKILTGLQHTLKLGLSTAVISAGILIFQPGAAQAQTFAAPLYNPFSLTSAPIWNSSPAFADLDNDGDLDMMSMNLYGYGEFFYFENTGTAATPSFAPVATDPFGLTDPHFSTPAETFADLDGDGDFDMIVGELYGNFYYYENTGTASAPAFAAPQINPFSMSDIGAVSTPTFADLDGDGDLDLMAGGWNGFFYMENTGTATAPAFAPVQQNPFSLPDLGKYRETPAFADLDKDGDLDMMSGLYFGNFYYFENVGTPVTPGFAAVQINPFSLTNIGYYSCPAFADLDGDGDLDLMSGEYYGGFYYFQNSCGGTTVYSDVDGDHYGDPSNPYFAADCIAPVGYVSNNTDCNDADASINPGATEICNGLDDDCNTQIDEGVKTTFYADADIDGYGNPNVTTQACEAPSGYVINSTDCNDANVDVNPGATEICNGVDDNCNTQADEGLLFYADADNDGYGNPLISSCDDQSGYVSNGADCNDSNHAVNPGSAELCGNAIDDNCNSQVDENCCTAPTGLTVVNISATTAKLKWNDVAGAEGYKVRYKITGTNEWKHGVTNNHSKPLSNLVSKTAYTWKVKTYCIITPSYTSDWSSEQTFTTSSLKEGAIASEAIFNVYPNPTSGTVNISIPDDEHALSITICNVFGEELEAISFGNKSDISLDVSTQPNGMYFVKVISEKGIEMVPFVLQK